MERGTLPSLEAMRHYVQSFPIEIEGFPINQDFPTVEESGCDPLKNAQIKARAFYQVLRRPVFPAIPACFFDEALPEDQPGTHVRRDHGKSLTDEEMIAYYAALSGKYGGRLTAHCRNAICLIMDGKHIYRGMEDSLSVDPNTGMYHFDLPELEERDVGIQAGFACFLSRFSDRNGSRCHKNVKARS